MILDGYTLEQLEEIRVMYERRLADLLADGISTDLALRCLEQLQEPTA